MSITNEQIVEHISNMSVLDVANLVKELEEKDIVNSFKEFIKGDKNNEN